MPESHLTQQQRQFIKQRANGCCEYCQATPLMPAKMAIASDCLKSWSTGEAMRSHIQYAVGLPVDGKQEQCGLWVRQRRRVHQ